MAELKDKAPETAGAAALQTVGDAFEALSASGRLKVIGDLLEPPEPPQETPAVADAAEVGEDGLGEADLSHTEPEPEAEAAEAEAEAPDEQEPEDESGWERRLGKELRKRKEAEEQAQVLQQRAEAAEAALKAIQERPDPELPPEINPVNSDEAVKQFTEQERLSEAALARVNEWLPRVQADPEAVAAQLRELKIPVNTTEPDELRLQLEVIRETLREHRLNAKVELRLAREKAANRIQARVAQSLTAATKEFPWLADAQSAHYQEATRIMQSAPWLKAMPDPWRVLAEYTEGRMLVAARKAKPPAKLKAKAVTIPSPKATPALKAQPGGISADDRAAALLGQDQNKRLSIIEELLKEQRR